MMFLGLPGRTTSATVVSQTVLLLGYRERHEGMMSPAALMRSTSSGRASATSSAGSPSITARAYRPARKRQAHARHMSEGRDALCRQKRAEPLVSPDVAARTCTPLPANVSLNRTSTPFSLR